MENFESLDYSSDKNRLFILKMMGLIALLMFFASSVFSQESIATGDTATNRKSTWEGLSLTFLTGETSLTKGNTLTAVWRKGKSVLITDINNDLGEFMYLYYPKKWFSIGPSAGFLYGRPYLGPIGTLELVKGNFSIKTLDWFGWDFGNSVDTCSFLFSYHQITVGYLFKQKVFSEVYYANQYFKREPEHIFGIKETFNLNNKWSVFGGWAYTLNANYHLWSCGVNLNL